MQGDRILVLDFGGQQALSTAQRLRSIRVFSLVLPGSASLETIRAAMPKGIVLAGGDAAQEPLPLDCALLDMGIPVLATGASARRMAEVLGGQTHGVSIDRRTAQISFGASPLFSGLEESDRYFDRVEELLLPEGMKPIANSSAGLTPAFSNEEKRLYGLQFYAESNDPDGLAILRNFALDICQCDPWWTMEEFVERKTQKLRQQIGDGNVLMAISGGVDSSVSAALLARAVGDRLTCLFVDTGLLRKGEVELVERAYREQLSIRLVRVDARQRVLAQLSGVTAPEEKRRRIENTLFQVVQEQAAALGGAAFTADGAIYPDMLVKANLAKTDADNHVLHPLQHLFKAEVRLAGEVLQVPREMISRQPFPGPGLAIRIMGEVTENKLTMLREADAIFRQEIAEAGLDKRIWQYFAILTGLHSFGTRDGQTCYETAVALRAVSSSDAVTANAYRLPYDLLERVALRITTEIPGINRVLYDVTGKPSAMIEWE